MTRDEETALCEGLKAKAALFVREPAKGHAAGYRRQQRFELSPDPQTGLDRPPAVPTRSEYVAWLYGVAQKDLAGKRWTIIEGPEEPDLMLT